MALRDWLAQQRPQMGVSGLQGPYARGGGGGGNWAQNQMMQNLMGGMQGFGQNLMQPLMARQAQASAMGSGDFDKMDAWAMDRYKRMGGANPNAIKKYLFDPKTGIVNISSPQDWAQRLRDDWENMVHSSKADQWYINFLLTNSPQAQRRMQMEKVGPGLPTPTAGISPEGQYGLGGGPPQRAPITPRIGGEMAEARRQQIEKGIGLGQLGGVPPEIMGRLQQFQQRYGSTGKGPTGRVAGLQRLPGSVISGAPGPTAPGGMPPRQPRPMGGIMEALQYGKGLPATPAKGRELTEMQQVDTIKRRFMTEYDSAMDDATMLPIEGLSSEQMKRQEDEFAKQRILGYWQGIREGVSPFVAGEIQNWMLANKELFPTLSRKDFTGPQVEEKLPAVEAGLQKLGLMKPAPTTPTPAVAPASQEEPSWWEKLSGAVTSPFRKEKPAGVPLEKAKAAPVDIDLRRKVMAEIGRLLRQNLTGDEIIKRVRELYGEAGAKIVEEVM